MQSAYDTEHFKKQIDLMMPDTALFMRKYDESSKLYQWHRTLAKCLVEINNIIHNGWLDYFIDTASPFMLNMMADEMGIPDDIFEPTNNINELRRDLKIKNRIFNGILNIEDITEIALFFDIHKVEFEYKIDTIQPPADPDEDNAHAFVTIHLSKEYVNYEGYFPWKFPLIFNPDLVSNAKRFEKLMQRVKASYLNLQFIYDL